MLKILDNLEYARNFLKVQDKLNNSRRSRKISSFDKRFRLSSTFSIFLQLSQFFLNFLSFSSTFSVFLQLSQFFLNFLSFSSFFSVFPEHSQFFLNFLSFSSNFSGKRQIQRQRQIHLENSIKELS